MLTSAVCLTLAAGVAAIAWFHFNPQEQTHAASPAAAFSNAASVPSPTPPARTQPTQAAAQAPASVPASGAEAVEVVITAHQRAWVEVSADGKTAFTGTLKPD